MKVRVHAEIEIPRVPNFFKTPSSTIPISAVPEAELRRIGEQWTEDLIARAAEQDAGAPTPSVPAKDGGEQ